MTSYLIPVKLKLQRRDASRLCRSPADTLMLTRRHPGDPRVRLRPIPVRVSDDGIYIEAPD